MRPFFTSILLAFLMSFTLNHELQAYCARCVKIESDREALQGNNPQSVGYYDEQISLEKTAPPHAPSTSLETKADADEEIAFNDISEASTSKPMPSGTTTEKNAKNISYSTRFGANSGEMFAYSTLFNIFDTKNFLNVFCGPFTLLIPTNEAFHHIKDMSMQDLVKPDFEDKLSLITSYHVVSRQILRQNFIDEEELKTIGGGNLKLKSENGVLFINHARVVRVEPAGSNGIIYIIDELLLPPNI